VCARRLIIRNRLIRENDNPGNVFPGKWPSGNRLSGKRFIRENDHPGNDFPGNVFPGKIPSGKVTIRETTVNRCMYVVMKCSFPAWQLLLLTNFIKSRWLVSSPCMCDLVRQLKWEAVLVTVKDTECCQSLPEEMFSASVWKCYCTWQITPDTCIKTVYCLLPTLYLATFSTHLCRSLYLSSPLFFLQDSSVSCLLYCILIYVFLNVHFLCVFF